MPIGKRLSDLLTARSENVNSISNQIGVSPQTIYSIIKRDNMKVDFDVLMKLSKALNVSVEYFYEPQISQSAQTVSSSEKTESAEQTPDKIQLLNDFDSLNDAGQKAALIYMHGLTYTPEYKKCDSSQEMA